ncbi:MAG: efflux RND transporter permease subunit [Ignavibacteria bacterium]|nr:efflux RND transporter permease subunit [Ignavibacteria bacterium]
MTGIGSDRSRREFSKKCNPYFWIFRKEPNPEGLSREESVIQSGMIRLRPVFLTAAATILGLVPLTTGVDFDWRTLSWVIGGQNTAFWRPMGVAIIFGLSVATFLTLVVVPTIFVSVNNILDRFKKKETESVKSDIVIQPD